MARGLQAWAPNGELITDTNDRYYRIVGSGVFQAPNFAFPGNDSYADIHVGNALQIGPDCSVVATGGGAIEIYSGFFRWRVGQIGIGPGGLVHWAAWAR